MGRYKTLLSNTLIFTISGFASKLLVFLMLPVYTRAMTTSEFGAIDLINSSVGLLMPVFTVCIADGALRFAMSRDADDKQVFSFGLKVIFAGFGILLLAFPIFMQIGVIKEYLLLFYLTYITSAIQNYLNQFARGINKVKLVGICGVLSTVIVVTSNIVLLLVFSLGVTGYLLSFIFSYIISSIVLFVGGGMYRYLLVKHSEKQLKTNMLKYSIPLVPNSLSWWLNNTANRYIITAFCGVSEVGLFAVATRIPTILITFQGIFIQAWQLSAISEFDKEDREKFFSIIYRYYNLSMLMGCSLIILASKIVATLLFSKDFLIAWRYIPFLTISVVFGAMIGFFSSIYLANKKTKVLFITTLFGGLLSVVCNIVLIPLLGPMGASITSPIAYFTIWLILYIDTKRFISLEISLIKNMLEYGIIIVQAMAMVFIFTPLSYLISTGCLLILIILNIDNLNHLIIRCLSVTKKQAMWKC